MKYETQACLVSDQPIPNLIPILDADLRPSRVILLVTPDKQRQGRWLEEVVRGVGCDIETYSIAPYSFQEARTTIESIVDRMSGDDIALNVTGGTKIMALAAMDVFRPRKRPVFYVDTHNGQILHLLPVRAPIPMSNVLKVDLYLKSYGYAILPRETKFRAQPAAVSIGQSLAANTDGWGEAVKRLNGITGGAQRTLEGRVKEDHRAVPRFSELVALFEAGGFVKDEGDRLRFPDAPSRLYVNGGWLEDYVIQIVGDLHADLGIASVDTNVHVKSAEGSPNELDVAFIANNRLHLIECKTGGMDAQITYKINTLKSVAGGTFGKAMLVSFHPLADEHKQRCSDLRIGCLDGSGIKQLGEGLVRWVRGK